MQLLAGVKLCTGQSITNHPHYEDEHLRFETKEIYGRRTPPDVHDILTKYKSSYIILEDSICLAPSKGCRTPDIVDIDNGTIPDHGKAEPGLVRALCQDSVMKYNSNLQLIKNTSSLCSVIEQFV